MTQSQISWIVNCLFIFIGGFLLGGWKYGLGFYFLYLGLYHGLATVLSKFGTAWLQATKERK